MPLGTVLRPSQDGSAIKKVGKEKGGRNENGCKWSFVWHVVNHEVALLRAIVIRQPGEAGTLTLLRRLLGQHGQIQMMSHTS